MYIEQLHLRSFRGAQELSLNLNETLNIFVGINGAGKSSVLDASAILLSWVVNRIRSEGASGRPISEPDIKNGEDAARLSLTLRSKNATFSWVLAKSRSGRRQKKNAASSLKHVTDAAETIRTAITEKSGNVDLPLFAYYPVNRAVLDIPLRIRKKQQFEPITSYDGSLTSGANFRTFFEWFREREDLENEVRRDLEDTGMYIGDSAYPDIQLDAVRGALSAFLPEFRTWRVRRNPLRMEVDKNNERLTVGQLSDGEKCLMAMIGDLARRMAIANPVRDNPLHGDGVILIDEIDLHLHPKWQRNLVPRLTKVFPNCQFLISTHSPHVITHVQPENLFLLNLDDDGLSVRRPEESYGKSVERVLEDLMGLDTTRPDEIKKALQNVYEQIDAGALPAARNAIAELGKQIGDDPELTKAGVLIRRKELIGK